MTRFFLAVLCLTPIVASADWPRFRGPNGTGVALDAKIAVSKLTADSVAWKYPVEGKGNSSPIVVGGKVIFENATPNQGRELVCLDAAKGTKLWAATVAGGAIKGHAKNSPASSTPTSDGKSVFGVFWDGAAQTLAAWDLDGKPLWTTPIGAWDGNHGAGLSPIVFDGKVFLNNDQDGFSEVQCYSAKDGKLVWKKPRKAFRACYSTPLVLQRPDSTPLLVVASTAGVTGYEPKDGKIIWDWTWEFDGSPLRTVGSPVAIGSSMIYAFAGDGAGDRAFVALAVDSAKPALKWQTANDKKAKNDAGGNGKAPTPYVPTPVIHDGYLYWVTDNGIACCVDAKTGKAAWTERLGSGGVTASPVLTGDEVLVVTESGTVQSFRASPKGFEETNRIKLGETTYASPAVDGNKLFVRTAKAIYAFESK